MSYLSEDSYATGPSQVWGQDAPKNTEPYAKNDTSENGFYDSRDDMVGGTDTQWTPDWSSSYDNAPAVDAAKWSTTDALSQADLAS